MITDLLKNIVDD